MRFLLAFALSLAPISTALSCSCAGPGTPCFAAGSSAAVFMGTVLDIVNPNRSVSAPVPAPEAGQRSGNRRAADAALPLVRPLRVVKMQVREGLSGLAPGQENIEIATGSGGGDCGYPFQVGMDYVVYAYKNAEGRLETGICTRTRPLAQASEDLEYFHAVTAETSQIRVLTSPWGVPGQPGIPVVAAGGGFRYQVLTNADGAAVFAGLRQGEYAIHAESDGELPDDPKVELHPKGCLEVYLFRALRINGLVTTRSGLPAARIEVQVRSAQGAPASGAMTGPDGRFELRIDGPGEYYLGVNLNHTATRDSPYVRWFYPGTEDSAVAARVVFSGKPEARTYDFSLPDPQPQRVIEGITLQADGQPMPRAVISVFDSSQTFIGQAIAGPDGRFALHVFGGVRYRLHAVWPGNQQEPAVSAPPVDIPAETSPLSLQLTLTQPGNSALEERQPGHAARR